MKHDDTELLKAAKRLDGDALRAIFDTYSSAIYNYALRLCGNCMEADNIVGDTFALLLEQLAKGKGPETNLRSYLYQTAYRQVIDHSRDQKHYGALELAEQKSNDDSSVARQAEKDAELEFMAAAMKTELTEDQRHVLMLRFVEGFNVEETAHITGKSVANVKVIQSRGVEKLRQAFGNKFK